VQIRWDAGERKLTDEQRRVQPRVPFFLFDELLALSVQLGERLKLCHGIHQNQLGIGDSGENCTYRQDDLVLRDVTYVYIIRQIRPANGTMTAVVQGPLETPAAKCLPYEMVR